MHRNFQLSLLGTGQGRGYLFGRNVLERYLEQHATTAIPAADERARKVREWLDALQETNATEAALEQKFVNDILCDVLGYRMYPAAAGITATIYSKPGSRQTGIRRTPDAALGFFSAHESDFLAAVELKTPGTDLDEPQPNYEYESPVEQGFHYGRRILGTRWVIVTDMRIVRLYSVQSADEFEEIDLAKCLEGTQPTASFRRLLFLLHYDYLIKDRATSQVALLYGKSSDRQLQIRERFYDLYFRVRSDLYDAIRLASSNLQPAPDRGELLQATQRLLDRLLFIYFCEDHPQQLIPQQTIESVTKAARQLPGKSSTRVYEFLKHLFREIDSGSPPESGMRVSAYNGELFKPHRIIDNIELPDALHDRKYTLVGPDGERQISGVWGLHVYDFWSELNEYLLGHIFEESLSDLSDLGQTSESLLADKLKERKAGGIFFTSSILADFLCGSAVQATLDDVAPLNGSSSGSVVSLLNERLSRLLSLRAVDFACGSGAFLTALYRELAQEFWRLQASLASLNAKNKQEEVSLLTAADIVAQSRLLPKCVFGVDKLPQAVEIAKLAIWLRSARKDEKVLDLSSNLIAGDSLALPEMFSRLGRSEGEFDLVVGNPPWGGEIDSQSYAQALSYLGLPPDSSWDTWELFLLLGIRALREGGRLSLVLPDSLMYPQKAETRRHLFETMELEKVHYLGPDWFGPDVRMGTIVIQARRGVVRPASRISCMLLSGSLRQQAIRGEVPLSQLEAQRSREIPVQRVLASETRELEIFRSLEDDRVIEQMIARSNCLGGASGLCERARGEEINKAGLLWICPSCLNPTTPGAKQKGKRYANKRCETCGHTLTATNVEIENLVVVQRPSGSHVPFIDGDDINRRYTSVRPNKWLRLGVPGWNYKDEEIYRRPKILLRQAGIGICATLDETNARCPQSVYIYRLQPDEAAKGYKEEYVLAALLSRTIAYLVFKRFAEVDPAKAHAKLTHERLAGLPIPKVDFQDRSQQDAHERIVALARILLAGNATLGGSEDREVEQLLRSLWGLSSEDGAYINGEFADLPESQVVTDLFPGGRSRRVFDPH